LHGTINSQNIKNKMTGIPEHWKQISGRPVPENIQKSIRLAGYSEAFLRILINRNLDSEDKILKFLKKISPSDLHDPFLIPQIKIAAERIKKAIKHKEKIVIFGDYDADGIISSHIVSGFLRKSGLEVNVHIPDRIEEGYDISVEFLKKTKKEKPDAGLIICVDCGTNSSEVIRFVNENSQYPDIIAADHHIMNNDSYDTYKEFCKKRKPETCRYIIVNPHLKNSRYPFKDLSGAAVSFKLINAVLLMMDKTFKRNFSKDYLTSFMDMIAISTVTDLMPLIDENRLIVKWGLKILEKTGNKGLKMLLANVLPDKKEYSVYDIGFVIGPRLNASGRIENAMDSFELINNKYCMHDKIIEKINASNNRRKKMQENALKKIFNEKKSDFEEIRRNKKIFIEKSTEWHEGLIGLMASELVKKLHIPVILFKEEKNCLRGSGRSIEGFDLFGHLNEVKHVFEKFGGHKMACGITIGSKNDDGGDIEALYHAFKKKMEDIAVKNINDLQIQKKFRYDCEISFADISSGLYEEIKELEPFGTGNPRPSMVTRDCRIRELRFLKDGRHVRLLLQQSGIAFRAVMFNLDVKSQEKLKTIKKDDCISILYYLDENSYNGVSYLQLVVLDLLYK
jgi:single-stranded-DNA-specific exonuclease